VTAIYQMMPDQTPEEYAALKADIALNGILIAIEVDEDGNILDGHHRVRAWRELRAEGVAMPDYATIVRAGMTDAQKRNYVRRLNLVRRHLSQEQRAELMRQMRQDGATYQEIADAAGVDAATAWRAAHDVQLLQMQKLPGKDGKSRPAAYAPRQMAGILARNPQEVAQAVALVPTLPVQTQGLVTTQEAAKIVRREQQAALSQQRAQEAAGAEALPVWLLVGDMRTLGARVADDSVDLILTDPPYNEGSADLYTELARFARRVLKPGGVCLAYSGQLHLPQIYAGMGQHLTYMWTCGIGHSGGVSLFNKWRITNRWKPLLMYGKAPLDSPWWDYFDDFVSGGREKAVHPWQQAVGEATHYITALSPLNGLVCDPFLGSGTTLVAAKILGRRYIGIERDPATAALARQRIEEVGV
jgi:site-specific DNA-methyltransferase (adenine-specific)